MDVDATITNLSTGVTPDSVQADANIALQPSRIGSLDITRGNLEGSYHESVGNIRVLDVAGHDVNVKASGTLALNDIGQSNLKVHADTPSLEQVGKLVNQPLAGIAKIDATVTGNRRQLQATGNVTGNGVKYGDNGALTMSSDFTAKVPELTVADADVTANTHATFVTVSGQNINELDAKTTYHQKALDFNATAKQPQRSLAANGSLLIHPDHNEIHLESLGLTSQGVQWQTAPNIEAAIRFFPDAIEVKNLELVNGDQKISAEGTFGRPGDALKVTLNNIDVASVDALLLRPPQLSGRLTATGIVSGAKDKPQVKADFQVTQGGFRNFHYESFNGKVDYAGSGLTVDTRLQQNATTYLTAKGYVPVAAFSAVSAEARAAAHGAETAAEDRIDLHVESTPIDLGLVQGFTNAVTNVKGTLQANVDITGSAADPHPNGTIAVANASFTVPQTGVNYTNLQGRIDLLPDKVHIDNIAVLDNHQNALSITGDLAVHEKQLGALLLNITARDFKIIDNKMGNVRINSDVQLGGELRTPRIEGELGIETGSINIDEVLARTSDSAYATRQTEYLTKPEEAAPAEPATPSPYEALKMDVHLTVPDDLVVKASSLQTPDAPIGLGAMNVTLGGDIRATKEPGSPIVLVGAVNTVRSTRQRPRQPQAAGYRAEQHPTARTGGHSVADCLQPAAQSTRRRRSDLAASARPVAGRRCPGGRAGAVDWQRARRRHLRDQPDAGKGRRPAADRRSAGRTEPLPEGGADHRPTVADQFHHRVRAHQVAPPPDQSRPGLLHTAADVPEDRDQRRRFALLFQLLAIGESESW